MFNVLVTLDSTTDLKEVDFSKGTDVCSGSLYIVLFWLASVESMG